MDPEFERSTGTFLIKNWWWERGVDKTEEPLLDAIEDCLAAFARYLKATEIRLGPEAKRDSGLAKAIGR
jgi:uncharacterized protein YcaQ